MELAYKRQGFIIYKLIPCLIITMFAFMCLYGSNVYATDFSDSDFGWSISDTSDTLTLSYNNKTTDLSSFKSNYSYYLIDLSTNGSARVFFSNEPFYIQNNVWIYTNSAYTNKNYYFGNFWVGSTPSLQYVSNNDGAQGAESIIFSNADICDNKGNVVFQAPPQVPETQVIIAEQVGEVEMNKTLQEILGILPVVIVVLVGLIALRKAIQFLIVRMKKA